MNDFLNKLKDLYNCHTALGDDVSNRDLIMQIVMGLGSEYNPITSVLITQQPLPTFEECRSLLLMEESKLQKQHSSSIVSEQVFLAQSRSPPTAGGCFAHRGGRGGRLANRGGRGIFHSFRPQTNTIAPNFSLNTSGILGPSPHASTSMGI